MPVRSLILKTTQCRIKDVFEHAFQVHFVLNSDGCLLINDINKFDNYERYYTKFGDHAKFFLNVESRSQ